MIQCFYGVKENDSVCPQFQGKAEIIRTAGGHHFETTTTLSLGAFSTAFGGAPE